MRLTETNKTPLARSEGLLIQSVGDETIAYDLETKDAHCLRPVAAFVFARCDGENSVAGIAAASKTEFSRVITEDEVADAAGQLEQIGLLESPTLLVVDRNGGFSRRDVMRMGYAGAAATVGTGLVMSIAAPTALAACSGQPAGCSCTQAGQSKECASGHCCGSTGDKCNSGCCATSNDGASCKCNNGTCPSIPVPPTGCCTTACTGTGGQICSGGPTTNLTTRSHSSVSGGQTLSTPGGSAGGGTGGTTSTPTTPATGGTTFTPTTPTNPTTPTGP